MSVSNWRTTHGPSLARSRTDLRLLWQALPIALSISERTVAHHIQHANDKIGFSTRGAVVLYGPQCDRVDQATQPTDSCRVQDPAGDPGDRRVSRRSTSITSAWPPASRVGLRRPADKTRSAPAWSARPAPRRPRCRGSLLRGWSTLERKWSHQPGHPPAAQAQDQRRR